MMIYQKPSDDAVLPNHGSKIARPNKISRLIFGAQIQNRLNQMVGGKTEILFSVLWLISGRDLFQLNYNTHTHTYTHAHTYTRQTKHTQERF
jgi:hypothetical protein